MPITKDTTTIRISKRTQATLFSLKEHPRETYEDVMKRLIEKAKKVHNGTQG